MQILIVVDSINIDDSSGSKSNVALINNLNKAGFEIFVYHYTKKEIRLEGISTNAIPEIKYSPLYFLSRTQRVLTRTLNWNLMPFLESIFGFSFTFFNDVASIKRALKKMKFEPELILTLSKGGSFRPHYAVLHLPEFHKKWMAYIHDPFPFHFYPRPYNWVEPGHKKKELFFMQVSEKSRYSAFPSYLLKEWMGSYFPRFLKTGSVIPHQSSKYQVQNANFPKYFDVSKFTLLHSGNLLKQRSPEGLLKGFELFLKQNPQATIDSKLILLGPASYHTKILDDYKSHCPEIYIHNGNIPFDEVYKLQNNVSVNIILEAKSEISPFLPAKFPHCIEANKMILLLAPYYSETRRLLGNSYEFWCEVDDIEKIAIHIKNLYLKWKHNPDDLLLNRKDLEEYLSATYLRKEIINLKEN